MTKNQSKAIKGAAIILMMWHHLYLPGRFTEQPLYFWPINSQQASNIAVYCKICVSLFAFVSGYGLFLSYKKNELTAGRWILARYIKSFQNYWFIVVLSWLVCTLVDARPYQVYGFQESWFVGGWNMLAELLGITHLIIQDSPFSVLGTWWYMGAALAYILILPVIYRQMKSVGSVCTFGLIFLLPRVFGKYPGGDHFYTFLPSFFFGMLFAERNLWERVRNKLHSMKGGRCWTPILSFVFVLLSYKISFFLKTDQWWDIKYTGSAIAVMLFILEIVDASRPVSAILGFLGKHSTNIYLIHSFLRAIYMSSFIYSQKHCMLSVVLLLVFSLGLCYAVEGLKKLCKYENFVSRLIAAAERSPLFRNLE